MILKQIHAPAFEQHLHDLRQIICIGWQFGQLGKIAPSAGAIRTLPTQQIINFVCDHGIELRSDKGVDIIQNVGNDGALKRIAMLKFPFCRMPH